MVETLWYTKQQKLIIFKHLLEIKHKIMFCLIIKGVRFSEITNLKLENLDLLNRSIVLQRDWNKKTIIRLSEAEMDLFEEYWNLERRCYEISEDEPFLFCGEQRYLDRAYLDFMYALCCEHILMGIHSQTSANTMSLCLKNDLRAFMEHESSFTLEDITMKYEWIDEYLPHVFHPTNPMLTKEECDLLFE